MEAFAADAACGRGVEEITARCEGLRRNASSEVSARREDVALAGAPDSSALAANPSRPRAAAPSNKNPFRRTTLALCMKGLLFLAAIGGKWPETSRQSHPRLVMGRATTAPTVDTQESSDWTTETRPGRRSSFAAYRFLQTDALLIPRKTDIPGYAKAPSMPSGDSQAYWRISDLGVSMSGILQLSSCFRQYSSVPEAQAREFAGTPPQ